VTRVVVGTLTAVEMLSCKSQRVVSGTVDLRECEFWKRN
jgi:hypothetical protein